MALILVPYVVDVVAYAVVGNNTIGFIAHSDIIGAELFPVDIGSLGANELPVDMESSSGY